MNCTLCGDTIVDGEMTVTTGNGVTHQVCIDAYEGYWDERESEMQRRIKSRMMESRMTFGNAHFHMGTERAAFNTLLGDVEVNL